MQMCLIFGAFIYCISFKKNVCICFLGGGRGRSCTAVFCENLAAICTHDRRLWIWMGNFISTASLPTTEYGRPRLTTARYS